MKESKKLILKVLVGSRAYGLSNEYSDWDYRGVYILPTSDILSLDYEYKGTSWIEGEKEDNTAYELGHFLSLAVRSNPSILEVFKAPIIYATKKGEELRKLFDYVWSPQRAYDSFIGYGLSQRKKFLNKKDNSPTKYAIAYLRNLYSLINLLSTKDFNLKIDSLTFLNSLKNIKSGICTYGQVIDVAEQFTKIAELCLEQCSQKPNIEKVNEFLIEMRKRNW